jgi:hypothetical protein
MDHGRFHICVGSRTKVTPRCLLLSGLLLVTVLVSPVFAETRVVSLTPLFDGFLQSEFSDVNGIVMNGQVLSLDFRFDGGTILESMESIWAELVLQKGPHKAGGDYPYDQYVVFQPGTTAHVLNASGEKLDVPMSDWKGGKTASPASTTAVLLTPAGLAGADMLAYPPQGTWVRGIHYDVVLPNSGETLYVGRIGLRLDTRYHQTLPDAPPPPPDPGEKFLTAFAIPDLGAASFTALRDGLVVSGYGRIQPDAGFTSPSGMVILASHSGGVLIGEAVVPDSSLITAGRIYAESTPDEMVSTGLSIANPNVDDATINFEFRNEQGSVYRMGTFTLKGAGATCAAGSACNQLTRSLDQEPYLVSREVQGTLTFTSTAPISAFAMRWTRNGRQAGEYLMAPVPVVDLSAGPNRGTQVIPLFGTGDGRRTEVVLVNPTGSMLTGTVQFLDPNGLPAFVNVGGTYVWSAEYVIAPNGAQRLVIVSALSGVAYGSVRVVPDGESPAPSGFVGHSFAYNGIMAFDVGVPPTMGTAFRMVMEQSPSSQIQTSFAIANATNSGGTVWFSLTSPDGGYITSASRYLPAAGLIIETLDSLMPELAGLAIKGTLRITTDIPNISMVGFRARSNEWHQPLYTAVLPVVENGLPSPQERFFPYMLSGGDFSTEVILFSGQSGQSSKGTVRFVTPDGRPVDLKLH